MGIDEDGREDYEVSIDRESPWLSHLKFSMNLSAD